MSVYCPFSSSCHLPREAHFKSLVCCYVCCWWVLIALLLFFSLLLLLVSWWTVSPCTNHATSVVLLLYWSFFPNQLIQGCPFFGVCCYCFFLFPSFSLVGYLKEEILVMFFLLLNFGGLLCYVLTIFLVVCSSCSLTFFRSFIFRLFLLFLLPFHVPFW